MNFYIGDAMIISKFVKQFSLEKGYEAYYHSLRMKPVFLSSIESKELQEAIKENRVPALSIDTQRELRKYMIVVESKEEDDNTLEHVRSNVPKPYISLAYFVLTEVCNLSCKYCFLGNSDVSVTKVTNYPMSQSTADEAIEFFSKQTLQDKDQFNDEKEIIFYGGEPLINFKIIKYIVNKCKYYQDRGLLSKKINYSMVTNGVLLNEEIISYLKENKILISISIDGFNEQCNKDRVDKLGNQIFSKVLSKIILAKEKGLQFGLSVTLTENTISDVESFISFVKKYDISSISFNIMIKNKNMRLEEGYYNRATDFIINFFKRTRGMNIYEDRINRKLQSFINSELYFSDCAATSGSQIVITPDGGVGICHGCMEDRKFFVDNIKNTGLVISRHKIWNEWVNFSPVFKEYCLKCEALGICGGGCPNNIIDGISPNLKGIDKAFCIHARKILRFFIEELFYTLPDINMRK